MALVVVTKKDNCDMKQGLSSGGGAQRAMTAGGREPAL